MILLHAAIFILCWCPGTVLHASSPREPRHHPRRKAGAKCLADTKLSAGAWTSTESRLPVMLNLVQAFWDTIWHHPFRRRFLWFLLVVNGIGAVSGYFWYENQLATTPWRWWIFVPDSPLSALIFTLALAGWLAGRHWPAFHLLACASVIKYGIWAVILISEYWWRGGVPTFWEWMLWLSHIGMAVEGVLYLRHLRLVPWHVAVVGAWLLVNDWVDYGWGFHPYLYRPDQWPLAVATAVILTVALIVVSWKNIYRAKQEISGKRRIY